MSEPAGLAELLSQGLIRLQVPGSVSADSSEAGWGAEGLAKHTESHVLACPSALPPSQAQGDACKPRTRSLVPLEYQHLN